MVLRPPLNPKSGRPNFDRDTAREAWRQVARVRSSRNLLGAPPKRNGPTIVVVVVLALGAIVAFSKWGADNPKPTRRSQAAVTTSATPREAPPSATPTRRQGERTPVVAPSNHRQPDVREPANRRVAHPTTRAPQSRRPPDGTSKQRAKALARIPRGRRDQAPVGGIGGSGLHIDRISLGTSYSAGHCKGKEDDFPVGSRGVISLCIRAVHLRQRERVQVRWERQGRVVRRAWLTIPALHAYRTRATLRLRQGYQGHWRVRVLSNDGTELAQTTFTVEG